MPKDGHAQSDQYLTLAADIVSAYVSKNLVPAAELPALISNIHTAVASLLNAPATAPTEQAAVRQPTAAQVRKSIKENGLVSFLDGKPYKTLKRHLGTQGLDPRSYRERYGLPNDYPMVAPGYAKQRSDLTKSIGLGRPGAMAKAA